MVTPLFVIVKLCFNSTNINPKQLSHQPSIYQLSPWHLQSPIPEASIGSSNQFVGCLLGSLHYKFPISISFTVHTLYYQFLLKRNGNCLDGSFRFTYRCWKIQSELTPRAMFH